MKSKDQPVQQVGHQDLSHADVDRIGGQGRTAQVMREQGPGGLDGQHQQNQAQAEESGHLQQVAPVPDRIGGR